MKQVFLSLRNINNDARNTNILFIVALVILIPINGFGQKTCKNPPSLSLSENNGTTCYLNTVTVINNTFGGSATAVTITEDGHGSVVPSSVSSSPFSFSYVPESRDVGKIVTITLTTNNPQGSPCKAARASYMLTVTSNSSAPVIETIIQPTCTISTGSIDLSGLPSNADWTVTVNPGGSTKNGSGATATIPGLPSGTYTFTVSVSTSCTSSPSTEAVIVEQPVTPAPPLPGTITAPTCGIPTGSVSLDGLPTSGIWTLTRYPGTVKTSGSGTSTTISGMDAGIYNFSLANEAECVSLLSADVIIPAQPSAPGAPVIGTIIQPTLLIPTGSVTLTALPPTGTWTIIRSPGEVQSTGSGITIAITGLEAGAYTFKVRNNSGCLSPVSASVVISTPELPEVMITDPPPVCFPATIDLTSPEITEGSTNGLSYSYWTDIQATTVLETPANSTSGIYYIKGTAPSGLFDIQPVKVTVMQPPSSNAGPDRNISNQFNSILEATLGESESGIWFSDSDNIMFNDITDPLTEITGLLSGNNVLSWIVTNGVCAADTDNVTITVGDPVIPTFISPNGDSKNEYFVIQDIEAWGRTELIVFDRRGIEVYQNSAYNNKWNGVDYNDKPLMNDTYFFVLKSATGKSYSGYIVIRK